MSDFNSEKNIAVWFDIPVEDLDRACEFYGAVTARSAQQVEFDGMKFAVLDHKDGNGGCLVPGKEMISSTGGILVYLNVNGRIQDAVAKAEDAGGTILQAIHNIGPHGFRAIILDSEGNRLALHSMTDA